MLDGVHLFVVAIQKSFKHSRSNKFGNMDKQSDLLSNYVAKAVINNSGINITPDAEMESEHSSVCKQTVSDLVDTFVCCGYPEKF
jgi:hypothetical protein